MSIDSVVQMLPKLPISYQPYQGQGQQLIKTYQLHIIVDVVSLDSVNKKSTMTNIGQNLWLEAFCCPALCKFS